MRCRDVKCDGILTCDVWDNWSEEQLIEFDKREREKKKPYTKLLCHIFGSQLQV